MATKIQNAAALLGALGGAAGRGKAKARTSEQAQRAVMVRWAKHNSKKKGKK